MWVVKSSEDQPQQGRPRGTKWSDEERKAREEMLDQRWPDRWKDQ